MALYFANTEITGIKDLFPLSSKDITGLYFADTELFTVWGEYNGTLPATYSANGSTLADYRIYGAAGGVGDRTINLFDSEIEQGNLYAGETQPPTSENFYKRCRTKGYVPVTAGNTVTIKSQYDLWVYCYSNTTYVGSYGSQSWSKKFTFTIPPGINSIKIMFANDEKTSNLFISDFVNDVMLVSGSTAPSEYIPYGYKLDMSVSDGTTSTTTPIYIGDTPLGEDEYVSFKEQKVYRRTEQLFNYQAKNTEKGYQDGKAILQNGNTVSSDVYAISEYIEVVEGVTYTWVFAISKPFTQFTATAELLDNNKSRVSVVKYGAQSAKFSFEVPLGVKFIRTSIYKLWANEAMLTDFTPSYYIPYYDPQDPPVSLPALPTVDGTNIVDYAGQSMAVPSRFVAKYRKEGFK